MLILYMGNIIGVIGVQVDNKDKLLDVGAERAVLAGLIQYGIDGYITISDFVNDDTFGNHNNQIYTCVKHIINNDQSVDVASSFCRRTIKIF